MDRLSAGSAASRGRVLDRAADELIGLCRGILADGAVSEQEARFLEDWLSRHAEFADQYPFNLLFTRVREAMADGVLDEEEERDLLDCLVRLVGGEASQGRSRSLSTGLPYDDPPPPVVWAGQGFLVTGVFDLGPRAEVHRLIDARGGLVLKTATKAMRYLVVGSVGSADWAHSSYGRKIEKAVSMREQGAAVSIISEEHWRAAL